jgi:hypothetical protein
MHEFRAGAMLLHKCLANVPGLSVEVHDNGWVKDEAALDAADAVVIFADGGKGHPAVQGDRLARLEKLAAKGVGIGMMHYGVEVTTDRGGPEFKRLIGGHYEHLFSANPIWEPRFETFPDHPIARGVRPFQIKDEWYFNMRFADAFGPGNKPVEPANGGGGGEAGKFWPVLTAVPSDDVRKGPVRLPAGPLPAHRRSQRPRRGDDVGRRAPRRRPRFGFTGGHFHDNWGNDDFRKAVLNALVWVTKVEVPEKGVDSTVTKEELDQNLDPKEKK